MQEENNNETSNESGAEEQTPQAISDNNQNSHSEFELTFVLILIGLLGIGFLAIFIGFDGFSLKDRSGEATTVELQSPDDTPGRDPEVLGQRNDAIIGRYFTHRELNQALYYVDGECGADCMENWTPYLATKGVSGGSLTLVQHESGAPQYAWEGKALYTYNLDTTKSVLGDGDQGIWHLARP